MIREGEKDVTLRYLRKNPRVLAVSNYTDGEYTYYASYRT